MSVLLVNPMVAPQVQQTARALYETGHLHRFVTTLRRDPSALWQRLAIRGGKMAGYDFEAQLRRRSLSEVPDAVVETEAVGELLRLAASRLDRTGRTGDVAWEFAERAFGRAAARRILPPVDVVYSYEYCARPVFERATARGVFKVYETPAAEPRFVFETIRREIGLHPAIETAYHRHEARHEERRIAWRRAEFHAADLVIANSAFTRGTYAAAGLDVTKVRVVPLGSPPALDESAALAGGGPPGRPLRLVWAGKFGVLKGAHYLLEAWRKYDLGRYAELDIYGLQNLPAAMVSPLPEGLCFHGVVARSELLARFAQADALVFPTLSDGFGMVATEAWAQGLPVIMTRNAGSADLLVERQNGLLTTAGDVHSLAQAIEWCIGHRSELKAMRQGARATAARWQWSDYRSALISALAPALNARKGPERFPRVI